VRRTSSLAPLTSRCSDMRGRGKKQCDFEPSGFVEICIIELPLGSVTMDCRRVTPQAVKRSRHLGADALPNALAATLALTRAWDCVDLH
jgi:hypothetical protein